MPSRCSISSREPRASSSTSPGTPGSASACVRVCDPIDDARPRHLGPPCPSRAAASRPPSSVDADLLLDRRGDAVDVRAGEAAQERRHDRQRGSPPTGRGLEPRAAIRQVGEDLREGRPGWARARRRGTAACRGDRGSAAACRPGRSPRTPRRGCPSSGGPGTPARRRRDSRRRTSPRRRAVRTRRPAQLLVELVERDERYRRPIQSSCARACGSSEHRRDRDAGRELEILDHPVIADHDRRGPVSDSQPISASAPLQDSACATRS